MTNLKCSIFYAMMFLSISANALRQAVGHYTGNGGASKAISGLGFQPEAVLVKPANASSSFISTSTMSAGKSKVLSSANVPASNYVNSFDADGFTAGSSANASGIIYYYVALDADGDISVGTYTGSTSAQTMNLGYRPGMLWVLGEAGDWNDYGNISMDGWDNIPDAFSSASTLDASSASVSSYTATGFTVPASGSSGVDDGSKYNYVAFKGSTAYTGTYAGNGSATTINYGATPDWVIVKDITDLNNNLWFKDYDMPATTSYTFINGPSTIAINGITSTGFTVGVQGEVNTSGHTMQYFSFATTTGTLPVDLLSFTGLKNDGVTNFSWKTASEINSDHYVIERSSDGIHYESIGRVEALGNSSSVLSYSFTDEHPLPGNNYCRLKIVDKDESFEFSKTIVIDFTEKENNKISLYPNPVYDVLSLLTDGSASKVKILNINSQTLFETNIQSAKSQIDVSKLPQGIYLLRFENENNAQTVKFVKE